jgi:DNA-binding response OmpR family regulator
MATEFSPSKSKKIMINLLRAALVRLGDPLMAELATVVDSELGNSLQLGDVQIDFQAHELSRGDERIPLTPSEYEILMTLASGHGETVDYASLVKSALDYDVDQEEAKELIKRHIFTLRQKIGPDFEVPRYIVNVRGYGYRLISEEN